MVSRAAKNPSLVSYYVTDALYDRLASLAEDWQRAGPVPRAERPDAATREDCEALVFAEARLADDLRLEEWLDCYAAECIYWVPAGHSQADPRREVTLEIHDRRRLEDRIARVHTGVAYSMIPTIRTRHVLGNLEFWCVGAEEVRARASFILHTLIKDHHRTLTGWCGYAFLREGDKWRIQVKQVNLIDADQPQGNNTFFL